MYSNVNTETRQRSRLNTIKLSSIVALALSLNLTGCQTVKTLLNGSDEVIEESANNTADGYYLKAIKEIEDNNLNRAEADLKDLRTFFPASPRAQQALLDLTYVQFLQKKYEESVANAGLFIKLYPTHNQVDYAHYVQGVANMAIPHSGLNLVKKNQSERDTAYYRLAYSNFTQLLNKYPKSKYAPDAAKRSIYLYNQFAEHHLFIAKWYIKREAYVASANRAKLVFQNFPRSESVPESIAILAHSYDKLGLDDLSNEYKNLLKINYPKKLTSNGDAILSSKPSLFAKLPFTKSNNTLSPSATSSNIATKEQLIRSMKSVRQSNTNK